MSGWKRVVDWLDARTGIRAGRAHLLDEPVPPGVNWWFVLGSVLLFLLGLQVVSGVVLAMYYVPSPEHAYDSVRYIIDQLTFGAFIRGLHFFGASFIVIAAVAHMLRVIVMGSYKTPREVTWMTGVLLLLIILAFALTGYLLPWDQKAYWATTVTINVARGTPLIGEWLSGVLRGGQDLGALTLLRWYAGHVLLLPVALLGLVVAHVYLMRRHGISGPPTPAAGRPSPFFPHHAFRDTVAIALVFAGLVTLAATWQVPLDALADPSDATYVPRPEWYFMSLFQLLKYFPGWLEVIATIVLPGLVVGGLVLLPFLDRGPGRHVRERRGIAAGVAVVAATVAALTWMGLRDSPAHADPSVWGPLAIAGSEFAGDARCESCHRTGGSALPVQDIRLRRDVEWAVAHMRDPEVLVPGDREPPPGGMRESQALSIVSFLEKRRAGGVEPPRTEHHTAILAYGAWCASCHVIDGEGVEQGPDLTRAGAERDAAWLREWIIDPESVDMFANMPPFGDRLTAEQLDAVVAFLAARK
jgi:ubiquinol-cytochrome c reductase cytochrome b subunit